MSELDMEQPLGEAATVAFEDDSSNALGLDHAATRVDGFAWNERQNAILKSEEDAKGVSHILLCKRCNQPEKSPRHNSEKADHAFEGPRKGDSADDVSAHIRQVRLEHPEISLREAVRMGRERAAAGEPLADKSKRDRDYLGDSISSLMAHPAPKGGGSKSGNKQEKPSKWKCNECHLEFCPHRIPKSRKKRTGNKVGRRPQKRDGTSAEVGRSGKMTNCVKPTTPAAVKSDGTASGGEIIDAVVDTAQRLGVPISEVLDNLDDPSQKRCERPNCDERGLYAVVDEASKRLRFYCFEDVFAKHDWEKDFKSTG